MAARSTVSPLRATGWSTGSTARLADAVPWSLDDAEQLAADAPDTFFIPPAALRGSLQHGDAVKLVFRLQREDGETSVERMWVEVTERTPPRYTGVLLNDPALSALVACGDLVSFGPEHVCSYAYDLAALGYDPDARCFLLRRLAAARTPPPLLLLDAEGDWQAHADDATDGERADASNLAQWSLGYLTDRFPETTAALQEGTSLEPGSEVWWRWTGERYERLAE